MVLEIGHEIKAEGFVFTLHPVYISVHNLDGDLMAILPVLDHNGYRVVRTEEQFQSQVDFWMNE